MPPSLSNPNKGILSSQWCSHNPRLAGGQDASQAFGWDKLWQLQIDSTIAENVQNAQATWAKVTATGPTTFKPKTGAAESVLRPRTNPQCSPLSFGGCDGVTDRNATCTEGDAHTVIPSTAGNT